MTRRKESEENEGDDSGRKVQQREAAKGKKRDDEKPEKTGRDTICFRIMSEQRKRKETRERRE